MDDQWKHAFHHRMAITLTSTVLLLGIAAHADESICLDEGLSFKGMLSNAKTSLTPRSATTSFTGVFR